MERDRPHWVDGVIAPQVLSIPPYVPGKPIVELQRELGISDAVKMASNENPLGPSPLAVAAVKSHLSQIHVYPESSAPDLRPALASRFGLSPGSVILGNGSDEIMQMCSHVFMRSGCEAIMGENVFSMYRICTEGFGGDAIRVPLRDHRFDLTAMSKAITSKTRLVFLAIPNNPTGTIVSRADFENFLGDLPKDQLLLVLDEAYREYVAAPDCPDGVDYVRSGQPVIVLRTFSKIYGLAGLRVGYGFAEPWLIELLNRVRAPFNVNSLAQVAALAALDDHEHLERSLSAVRDGMTYLTRQLSQLGFEVIPSEANFVTFCGTDDANALYQALLREGWIVRHLASFGMPNCIRITVGKDDENRRFIEALNKVLSTPAG